ncbi:MAG: nucleotidyltransferase family protein [Hyphomicrobiales bacterium]|nr:nucleotidyltransferase family protein [Hyphomicrobiales bacterium]
MSKRAGHAPLSPEAREWLVFLCDPEPHRQMPSRRLCPHGVEQFADAVCAHGVGSTVVRNLRALDQRGRSTLLFDAADGAAQCAQLCRSLADRLVPLAAQMLLLEHHARLLSGAFAGRALAAHVVKGPVFARRLYPRPADRTFTDIDVLVAPASLAASLAALRELGFVPASPADAEPRDRGEHKWLWPGREFVMIELQTDLIHSANLGSGIRLSYDDLLAAGAGNPEDATALLLVAAVHAAAGHQFERLQTCVDVLQAARGAAGPVDGQRLAIVAAATGATAALQSALDLAARMFDEPAAAALADAMPQGPWRRLRRRLVTPPVVLRAQGRGAGMDSWRRRALRDMIRRSGRSTILRENGGAAAGPGPAGPGR